MSLLCFELFSGVAELYWFLCFLIKQSSFFILFSFLVVTSQHQYQLLQRPFYNFRAFSLKNDFYWLLDFTNVRAQLFPDRQFSLYFLMNIETTRLQQSIMFNLYSIATYNKHLFTIILIIHVFAIFHRTTDIYFLYIHLFCFGIKIVKQCLFFFFTYRRFS